MSDSEEERSRSRSGSEDDEDQDDQDISASGSEEGSGSGSDERGSSKGSDDEENSDEEGDDDSRSKSSSSHKSGSDSGEESDDDSKKRNKKKTGKDKEKEEMKTDTKKENNKKESKEDLSSQLKPSKYQDVLSMLKDINKELDDVCSDVDKVYYKCSPQKERVSQNYHRAQTKEERKKSYSPRRLDKAYQQCVERDDEEHFNDRDGRNFSQETFGGSNSQQVDRMTKGYGHGQGADTYNYSGQNQSVRGNERPPQYNKQLSMTDRTGGFSQTQQPQFQRKASTQGRFNNAPSTGGALTDPQYNQQAPPTSYTQFYRNQSNLQSPVNYHQQQQIMNQTTPAFGSQPIGGPQMAASNGFSSQIGGHQQLSNPLSSAENPTSRVGMSNGGNMQKVENLQAAIDALLK